MKSLIRLLPFLVFFVFCNSCGNSDAATDKGWKEGVFTADMDGKEYNVDVQYYYDETNGLTMYSDKTDTEDSDGDGLIISVFQMGDNLQLDLVDNNTRYGGKITEWKMKEAEITGSGDLMQEDDFSQTYPVSFTIKRLK